MQRPQVIFIIGGNKFIIKFEPDQFPSVIYTCSLFMMIAFLCGLIILYCLYFGSLILNPKSILKIFIFLALETKKY